MLTHQGVFLCAKFGNAPYNSQTSLVQFS